MLSKGKHMRLLAVLLIPTIALILGATVPQAWATGFACFDEEEGETVGLDECKVFFEFQKTDCDVGLQIFADGPPWKGLTVREKKGGKPILNVITRGTVRRGDGGAEFHLEGGEPTLDADPCTLDSDAVQAALQQYRAGGYAFTAASADERCLLKCDTELTYLFPKEYDLNVDIPDPYDPNEDKPEISWEPKPEDENGGGDAETVFQEIVVEYEFEVEVDGETEEQVLIETATFFNDTTSTYTVSDEFLNSIANVPDDWELVEAKAELLSQEASGNIIIVEEVFFEAEEDE